VRRKGMDMNPTDLSYTREHEWIRLAGDVVRFGITDYAQDALGDIVFVNLPQPGDVLVAGDPCGEVESTKSVSDIYAPVSGTVTAVNDDLEDDPGRLNSDPFGSGWLVDLVISGSVEGLLPVEEYNSFISDL
jgi:glycine cleavage system H protein